MKTKSITTRFPEDLFREINEIGAVEKIDRAEVNKETIIQRRKALERKSL